MSPTGNNIFIQHGDYGMTSKIKLNRFTILVYFLAGFISLFAQSQDDYILSTLKYGIDEKVNETLNKLINEKNYKYDEEIYKILLETKNSKIKETIIKYFSSKDPPDERIVTIVEDILANRDNESKEVVLAGFAYCTKLKRFGKHEILEKILTNNEKDYVLPVIKLIGAAKLQIFTEKLLALYESSEVSQEVKLEALLALAELQTQEALALFKKIINRGEDAGKVERMYACAGLGKLKSAEAIELLAKALSQKDPNVRGSAVKALAEIGTQEVFPYIVQSLRDSHVIPRLAAVQAVGDLKITQAIPYLEYQFKQDPEKKVKEQAIIALGKIGSDACREILVHAITDDKTPDVYRALVFSVFVENFGDKYEKGSPVLEFFIKAMNDKTRTLFTEITRKIFTSSNLNFVPFVVLLLDDKDFTMRLNALVWIERNKLKDFLDKIQQMSETDPVENVRKKAQTVYENLNSGY